MHSLRSTFLALASLLLLFQSMRGQEQLLSLPEAANYSLSADIRIQAAARIDSTTLAVWGTTLRVSDNRGIPREQSVLVWQMMRGSTPVGQPQLLHDSTIRPSAYLGVVTTDSLFIVLWKDRALADGRALVRVRSIGRSGTMGLSPHTLDTIAANATPTPIEVLGQGDRKRLLWIISQNNTSIVLWSSYEKSSDTWSAPEVLDTVAGSFFSTQPIQHYATLPGSMMIRLRGTWRFVDARGSLDARPVPGQMIGTQISPDSSAFIEGSDGITLYRSFFQSQPDSIVPVLVDTALEANGWHEGTRIAGRTADGRWTMTRYGETIDTGSDGDTLTLWSSQTIQQGNGTWQASPAKEVYNLASNAYIDHVICDVIVTVYSNIGTTTYTRTACGNRIDILAHMTYDYTTKGHPQSRESEDALVVSRVTDSTIPPALMGCIGAPFVSVDRVRSDTISSIRVGQTTLSTPTAAIALIQSTAHPALLVIGDTLCWTAEHSNSRISVNNWPGTTASTSNRRYYAPIQVDSIHAPLDVFDSKVRFSTTEHAYSTTPGAVVLRSWGLVIFGVMHTVRDPGYHDRGISRIVAAVPDRTGMRTIYSAEYDKEMPRLSGIYSPRPTIAAHNALVSTTAVTLLRANSMAQSSSHSHQQAQRSVIRSVPFPILCSLSSMQQQSSAALATARSSTASHRIQPTSPINLQHRSSPPGDGMSVGTGGWCRQMPALQCSRRLPTQ